MTDAIDDANRAVLLIKYQQPSPSESEKQRYVAEAKASIEQSSRVRSVQKTLKQHRLNCLWTDVVMVVLISISDVAKNMSISEPKEIKPLLLSFGVKVTKGGGKDQNVFLSTYMGGDGWRNGWMMYWRNADGGIYRATWGETGGNICEPSLKAPEDGEWQHFLFVYSDKGLPGRAGLVRSWFL